MPDLYSRLGLDRKASTKEITSAYRRLALRVHPDHNKSPNATAEFQELAKAHQILTDPEKRRIYDQTGEADDSSDSTAQNYWRSVFPKITPQDIEEFRRTYIDSLEEKEDIINAVSWRAGNMKEAMECIPFADSTQVERLVEKIKSLIKNGELPKKWKKKIESSSKNLASILGEEEASESKEAEEAAKLLNIFVSKDETEEDHLRKMILAKKNNRQNGFNKLANHLIERYGDAEEDKDVKEKNFGEEALPSEEEFQKIQATIVKNEKANNQGKKRKGKSNKRARKKGKNTN